uniref:non-specific serine/threonine protein kinase n=1 Tax=Fagus sylvatica TaxID=28930 RepID=A0A2N9HDU0_FAGSY
MRLPEALPYPEVKNVEECKLNCLSHCDCNAYVYYNICLIYQGELMNLQQLSSDNKSGGDLHIRISAGSKNKISRKDAWIVGVIVAALISSIVSSIIWRVYYAVGALEEVEFSLILFKYQDIRRATKNFSQKLGEGGFGSVFKGTLPNSIAIAVKKIRSLQQGEKQFRAEVSTLGAIQHVNLLRLRGFCVEASKRFLVYEYMPKGSGRRNINMLDDEICNYFPARVAIAMNKGEDLLTC